MRNGNGSHQNCRGRSVIQDAAETTIVCLWKGCCGWRAQVRRGAICRTNLANGTPSTRASGGGRKRAYGSGFSSASAWHRRKRGTQNQAIGKSRGGLTTKIAVIVDALGNLIRFVLLPGQRHDIKSFEALMAGIHCLALIGDKGFDAGWLRERLRANDTEAVIPLRKGTSGYAEHDREKYKWRHLVENFFCNIKAFRRIATRYEKTDKCFNATVNLVAS